MTVTSNNAYKGFERSFCIRMKSTLTKRGCHFKSSGYRVSISWFIFKRKQKLLVYEKNSSGLSFRILVGSFFLFLFVNFHFLPHSFFFLLLYKNKKKNAIL